MRYTDEYFKLNKLAICKDLEKKALKLISKGLENKEILKQFNELSSTVCEYNDKFLAYSYAESISSLCYGNNKLMKAMHFNELQKIVMDSGDEEYMFAFGDRVCGADLKSLIEAMPHGILRNKLEKQSKPIEELDF